MTDYTGARLNMVESQVRPNQVTDERILTAMLELPRERFVPERLRGIAYVDEDVPLGAGRYLMEPMVLARLVQAAQIRPTDKVLEVGANTGYGTALIARLAKNVVAVEADSNLARTAERMLADLGAANARVVAGTLADGHAASAPYDVIVFAGAVEHIPSAIVGQLADHGRLVVVIAAPGQPGRATLVTKIAGALSRRTIFDAGTPVLQGLQLEPGFAF